MPRKRRHRTAGQRRHSRLKRILPSELARWAGVLTRLQGARLRDRLVLAMSLTGALARWSWSRLHGTRVDPFPTTLRDAVVVSRVDGTRFIVRGGSDDLYSVLPRRERDVAHKILAPLRPGDTFVDLGANVGSYTLVAARRVGAKGRVIAVEADPDTAATLQRAVALNGLGNVVVVPRAISDRDDEEACFEVPARHRGQARMLDGGGPLRGAPTIVVPTATLDTICDGVDSIRVLKIDVEGNEPAALRGGQSTLQRTESAVVETAYQSLEVSQLLREAGFRVNGLQFAEHVWARRPDSGIGRRQDHAR